MPLPVTPLPYPSISVVGPTSVGKTDVALAAARQVVDQSRADKVLLIGVDSRQVYSDIAVLSGADVPSDFSLVSTNDSFEKHFFIDKSSKIEIHGVGILSATESWSVGLFRSFVLDVLVDAQQRLSGQRVLVMLVGGTGLYHERLFATHPDVTVAPDEELRAEVAGLSVTALQERIEQEQPLRLSLMNDSDRANPRRLVRALEQIRAGITRTGDQERGDFPSNGWLGIGLTAEPEVLSARMSARITQRISDGALAEVQALESREMAHLRDTLGYKELLALDRGELDFEQAMQHWLRRELRYAKRQHGWWKPHASRITWFDRADQAAAVDAIVKWYTDRNE